MYQSTAAELISEVPMRRAIPMKRSKIAGIIIGDQAWRTELTQVMTTHGPMDIRIWHEMKKDEE